MEEQGKLILRVKRDKTSGQKRITIPKDHHINGDDYVEVIKHE